MNQAWRKAGTPGFKLEAVHLYAIWLDDKMSCRYCGIRVDLMTASFDHILPLSKGGHNSLRNLATCCITCQRSKYTKSPEEHAAYQALERVCRTCQRRFKPRHADVQRGYGWYCSRRCSGSSGADAR